jgi:hypothetical protein
LPSLAIVLQGGIRLLPEGTLLPISNLPLFGP